MNSDLFSFAIPCHLIDIHYLERYLEKQAAEGYLLVSFDRFFRAGKFKEIYGKTYHFSVDLYRKVLKKQDLTSNEFEEYIEVCEQAGWTYCCAYKNLVVFYSTAVERPLDLQTDEPLSLELLKKITLRTERRVIMAEMITPFIWISVLAGLYINQSYQVAVGGRSINSILTPKAIGDYILLFVVMMVPVLGKWIQYCFMARKIHKGIPLPKNKPLWDSYAMMGMCLIVVLTIIMIRSWQLGMGKNVLVGGAGLISCFILFGCSFIKYKNDAVPQNSLLEVVSIIAFAVAIIIIIASISVFPQAEFPI